MRKFLMSAMLAGCVTIGGCTTTQVTSFLSQVQAAAAAACLFVPTIDTILSVAGSLGFAPATAAAGAVQAVAAAICSQVPPPASARYQGLYRQGGPAKTIGTVGGVAINGWRV